MMRLPRRFRSRVLLTIFLCGLALLTVSYYFPAISRESVLRQQRYSNPSHPSWWRRFWATSQTCKSGTPKPASDRTDTAEVYPKLDFDVPDNRAIGFWNEVLESRYREIRKTWKDLPLEVIVVPHSHVDPGWLRTYDEYFENSVKHILDNMVQFLNKTEDFKFIWSEITYFSEWWHMQNKEIQKTVKKILKRKQLEIVTGGWVMTDEATTSYFSIIDQLIEGQQWLYKFTKTRPQHGWSVDVFGHSASLPYILSLAGMSETVILRTHYAWKSYLAKKRMFDFYWEQPFDAPRILCHMAPSDLYSFKHTCGPDPFSCLKYDFRKVGGEYSESTADEVNNKNVELKANYLISQYGRYASLYTHNVLLVPLGDDFRYNLYMEWVQQYENYKKLFDFINNKKEWNAHVKFGTVADYFDVVNKRLTQNSNNNSLSSIMGDFLPYGDIYADFTPSYWTGYYSTRPFYKKLSQELEHWLRTSEILYSLAKTVIDAPLRNVLIKDYSLLVSSRRKLGLFQHHDAITGTSKEYVMRDYGEKLHSGIIDTMSVTSHLAQMFLMDDLSEKSTWTSQIYPNAYRSSWSKQTEKLSVQIPRDGRKIVLFNSLSFERSETIRLKIRITNVMVVDSNGNKIKSQINPSWENPFVMSNILFELVFVADLKPLSFSTYTIKMINNDSEKPKKSTISLFLKEDSTIKPTNSAFDFERPIDKKINLESSHLIARFTSSGNLKEIYMKRLGFTMSVNLDFRAYIPKEYRSGAYLFQPELNDPIPINNLTDRFPLFCIVRGDVMSELIIVYHDFLKVTLTIFNSETSPEGLQVKVSSDISKLGKDVELVMRISSSIENGGVFFTDSNSLQMLKRQYVYKLPVQANYYPSTSAVFIEDTKYRLSVLVPYSHGVTSPNTGKIELMVDRKMKTDDSRGMGEGVLDNRLISTTYWLIPESFVEEKMPPSLTLITHQLSLCLQYPTIVLATDNGEQRSVKSELLFLSSPWPEDVHLVNLRTLSTDEDDHLPSNSSLMVIHERYNNCKMKNFVDTIISQKGDTLFTDLNVKSIVKTSLTGTKTFEEGDSISTAYTFSKLQSCKVTFQ